MNEENKDINNAELMGKISSISGVTEHDCQKVIAALETLMKDEVNKSAVKMQASLVDLLETIKSKIGKAEEKINNQLSANDK